MGSATDVQRISVTVTLEQLMRRTKSAFKGQFSGWNVYASGLAGCVVNGQEYEDDELLSVEFATLVDEENKVHKPKLKKREVIRRDDIDNLEEI
jgi:hypothetical protein